MVIKIPILCRSKKNSQQIYINHRTRKPFISQSKLYKEFEKECGLYLYKYALNINEPIQLRCTFYVNDRRKRDIVNLLNAIQDILVKYKVIADDNYNVVKSVDGSRIIYRKGKEPETIIEILEYKE